MTKHNWKHSRTKTTLQSHKKTLVQTCTSRNDAGPDAVDTDERP